MAKIEINIVDGGLGSVSTNADKYVGVVVHFATLPTGWTEAETRLVTRSEAIADTQLKSIRDEFYRVSPSGSLYVCATAVAANVELLDNLIKANSLLRTLGYISEGVADFAAYATNVGALHTKAVALFGDFSPARIVYGCTTDFSGSDKIADATQLTGQNRVIPVLASVSGKPWLGAANMLGAISANSVHQKVSWVGRNNQTSGEITTGSMATLTGEKTADLGQADIDGLSDKGYNFWRRYPKRSGVYWADFKTGDEVTTDYATASNARVIDKAVALSYEALLPYLDSPVYPDTNSGFLGQVAASKFESIVYNALQTGMVGGLSGDAIELAVNDKGVLPRDTVYVDPNQNVLADSTVRVQISITPVGASKNIIVTIGLRNPANQ